MQVKNKNAINYWFELNNPINKYITFNKYNS